MEWLLAIFGGSGWLAFGLIALRFSGVKNDRNLADQARKEQAKELLEATQLFKDQRARYEARIKDLQNDIEDLEEELLDHATPGERRNALNRLLQTPNSESGGAQS